MIHREKNIEKIINRFSDQWNNNSLTYEYLNLRKERSRKYSKFEEKNNFTFQRTQWFSSRVNIYPYTKQNTPRRIISKLLKTSDKEKIIKAPGVKI